jgi:tetratricopeptide (TPR) repeat protein
MKKLNNKTGLVLTVLCALHCYEANADYPKEIEISSMHKQINVGQPFILRLTYRFEHPQLSAMSGELFTSISPEANVQVKRDGKEIFRPGYWYLNSYNLYLQDKKGLIYSGNAILFYDSAKKGLIFDTPGIYTIFIRITRDMISKPLKITVKPASQSEKKVLSILSDPNDYAFLSYGGYKHLKKHPKRISQLKKVIEQFGSNVLAKMGAAQLGLEYFQQFHAKHPSFQKFKILRDKNKVKDPLFEQARKYLEIGAKLPDEFPIREDVLRQLGRIEYMNGNYEKVISIINELGTKYPKGKYGRKASEWKEELLELQKRGPK